MDWYGVAANVPRWLSGHDRPSSDDAPDVRVWGSRFQAITIRDQLVAEAALDALGIDRWVVVIGGSMGGMRLEAPTVIGRDRAPRVAVLYPDRVGTAIVLASTGYASAEQIAGCAP